MTSFFSRRREDEEDTSPVEPDSSPAIPINEERPPEEDVRQQLLRVLAELENLRRRSVREAENARRWEREEILRSFLSVLDSFDLALGARGAETNQWTEGFNAIREQMAAVFARFGVRTLDCLAAPFDPHQHEAVAVARIEGIEEGEIVEIVQSGYVFEDGTILRPAKVIVSGAPPENR
jgi:molecular chaperone GrpE